MDAYTTFSYGIGHMSRPRVIPNRLLPSHALQLNLTRRSCPITPSVSDPQQEVTLSCFTFNIPSTCFRHPYAAFSFVEDVMRSLSIQLSVSDVRALESCISGLDPDMTVAVVASVEVLHIVFGKLMTSDVTLILDAVGSVSESGSAGTICKDLLKKVKYERSDNRDEACPICLNEFKEGKSVASTPCSHLFHGKCIKNWIENKKEEPRCPLCRGQIVTMS